MKTQPKLNRSQLSKPWSREFTITLIEAGISTNTAHFSRLVAQNWLEYYPGDLEIQYLLAKSWFLNNKFEKAILTLEKLTATDPEYIHAQKLLLRTYKLTNNAKLQEQAGIVYALSGKKETYQSPPLWSETLLKARRALQKRKHGEAEGMIIEVLSTAPPTPLAGIAHALNLTLGNDQQDAISKLSIKNIIEYYAEQWKECLVFKLLLADLLLESGDESQGMMHLHHAVSKDITGRVARRIWGAQHNYRALWPETLEANIDLPIPADVAKILGWNQLPGYKGINVKEDANIQQEEKTSTTDVEISIEETPDIKHEPQQETDIEIAENEEILTIKKVLEKVAKNLHQPQLMDFDGRYPIYVILTTRKGLESKFGPQTTQLIENELLKVVSAIKDSNKWGAILLFADDAKSTTLFGLKPAKPDDPWAIKHLLTNLDRELGKKGTMIGAVLIIGGNDVVPYHLLPNPADDTDQAIPSDNPYATDDENYFIPKWLIGRIPGGAGNDPGLLLSQIRAMSSYHSQYKSKRENGFIAWIRFIIHNLLPQNGKVFPMFGLTAEAWHRASVAVYRTIDDPKHLMTSPPVRVTRGNTIPPVNCGYFNLHGKADASEWLGQRANIRDSLPDGDLFPIALTPQDIIHTNGRLKSGQGVPKMIFTEACYGAYTSNKTVDQSIALKFLLSGTNVFIGSTAIAYGSLEIPLTNADLLGKYYWQFIKEGLSSGEAFTKAKIYFANEVLNRYGYLDGAEQKTLLSFVHFGDPLFKLENPKIVSAKNPNRQISVHRPNKPPVIVKTICDRCQGFTNDENISTQIVAHVKNVVSQYLPGMESAEMSLHHETVSCNPIKGICPQTPQQKTGKVSKTNKRLVVLSKTTNGADNGYQTFARLTLDENGKLIKLSVSR